MREIPKQTTIDELWYSKCGIYFKPHDDYKLIYVERDTPMHVHMDFYEFTFVTKGSFVNRYNDKDTCYHKNALLFWKYGEKHAVYVNEPQSIHLSFLIRAKDFEEMCKKQYPDRPDLLTMPFAECYLSPEKANYLSALATKTLTCKEDTHEHFRLFLHIIMFHLFFDNQKSVTEKDQYIDNCISDIILKFESVETLSMPISKIYEQYPFCEAVLVKNFKKRTGQTIVEYRNDKRMAHAATLLAVQNLSVTEVASLVGIASLSYFSKIFFKYYGVHPNEYAQKYAKFPPTVPLDLADAGLPEQNVESRVRRPL